MTGVFAKAKHELCSMKATSALKPAGSLAGKSLCCIPVLGRREVTG